MLFPKHPLHWRKGGFLFIQKAGGTVWENPGLAPLSRDYPHSTQVATCVRNSYYLLLNEVKNLMYIGTVVG